MKRHLVGLVLLLMAAGTASGQTIWSEDFSYGVSAGNVTAVSGGNWVNHSGTTPTVLYQTTSLSLPGYAFAGAGGAVSISTSGTEDVNRSLGGSQSGDIFLSALVNVSASGAGAYFLHFKSTTTVFRAKVFTQDSAGTAFRFGLQANSETVAYTSGTYSYGTTYLLVLHYNAGTGDTDLHVLTSVPQSEPGTPTLTFTDAAPSTAMAAVAIRQASGGPSAVIDGLRVGTTWASLSLPVELMSVEVE